MLKVVGSIDRRHESRDYQRGESIKSVTPNNQATGPDTDTDTHTPITQRTEHTQRLLDKQHDEGDYRASKVR